MYYEYLSIIPLIYIYLYYCFDIYMQKIDISKKISFISFCLLNVFFCTISLTIYMGILKIISLKHIYNIVFPLSLLSLGYFVINIQHKKTNMHNFITKIFTFITLCIVGAEIFFLNKNLINENANNIYYTFFYTKFISQVLILLLILFLLIKRSHSKLKRDVISSYIIVFTVTLYMLTALFTNYVLNDFGTFNAINGYILLSFILATSIYYCIKKLNLLGIDISEFLLDALSNSPDAVCVIRNKELKYLNTMFYNIFTDKNKISSKIAMNILPSDFFQEDMLHNKVFKIKKLYSPEYVSVLCNKIRITDSYTSQNLDIITMLDISIIQESQKKIENINKNLEQIIHERTIELEKINKELNDEIIKRIDSENKMLVASSTDSVTGLYNRRYFSQISHNISHNIIYPIIYPII